MSHAHGTWDLPDGSHFSVVSDDGTVGIEIMDAESDSGAMIQLGSETLVCDFLQAIGDAKFRAFAPPVIDNGATCEICGKPVREGLRFCGGTWECWKVGTL